ncbi:single-stranded DNA-binding protein [Neokomagataea anthophila]|uniref:Single-stranded DNA-binding protein n=1 Tax=Neokomagataea anthophila TaxID=2826925 RepID=A0ABS5E838_9PROT|nr:single-stranded DNA-binding protein [Neokomagataea anthophila]MBR0560069.1 single-stranded DNA-binding protein [Neokomagataea anthophila]
MAGSVNKVILIGNAGRDPEIRHTQSGSKIANLTLATSDTWNDKQSGERKERTEWHRVVCFNDHLAGVIERFVKKGSKLYIEGELRTRKWTDQSGQEKYTAEVTIDRFRGDVTLLDSRNNGDQNSGRQQSSSQSHHDGYGSPGRNDFDDDLPF